MSGRNHMVMEKGFSRLQRTARNNLADLDYTLKYTAQQNREIVDQLKLYHKRYERGLDLVLGTTTIIIILQLVLIFT